MENPKGNGLSEDSRLTDNMDLDPEALEIQFDDPGGMENVALDFNDLVESIYQDKSKIFPGTGLPESPPDSSMSPSSGYLSPNANNQVNLEEVHYYTNEGQHFEQPQLQLDLCQQQQLNDQSQVYIMTNNPPRSGQQTQQGSNNMVGVNNELNHSTTTVDYSSHVPMRLINEAMIRGAEIKQEPGVVMPPPIKGRKRKDTSGSNFGEKQIKTEPGLATVAANQLQQHLTSPNNIHQPQIVFQNFQEEKWAVLFGQDYAELTSPFKFSVVPDKGFNYSNVDEAFIVQKKNHFQVTCQIQIQGGKRPAWIKTQEGVLKAVEKMHLNFYGVKNETPSSTIRVEQSQTDRSKMRFTPVIVDLSNALNTPAKVSVGRLHFTETTSNNMRKKGKPNPAQKYFKLVVSLEAVAAGGQLVFPVYQMASDKIIVRASNPGQFEADPESVASANNGGGPAALWVREDGDSIYYLGKVGVNTDQPTEALSIHGNLQLTGHIMQPSDARIKRNIRELDNRRQLENVNNIKIVQYKYSPEYLRQLPEDQREEMTSRLETGVIAQDVRGVLPDAVSSTHGGLSIGPEADDDMLIVNKDRLYLENIGAVRALSMMTDDLELRMSDLEKANETVAIRLARLKARAGSLGSGSSRSSITTIHKKSNNGGLTGGRSLTSPTSDYCKRKAKSLFHNKCVQILLVALMAVMAFSMLSMAVVYGVNSSKGEIDDPSDLLLEKIEVDVSSGSNKSVKVEVERQTERSFAPLIRTTTATTLRTSTTARPSPTTTTTPRRWNGERTQPPILAPDFIADCSTSVKCRSVCCHSISDYLLGSASLNFTDNQLGLPETLNEMNDDESEEDFLNNIHANILMVEPPKAFDNEGQEPKEEEEEKDAKEENIKKNKNSIERKVKLKLQNGHEGWITNDEILRNKAVNLNEILFDLSKEKLASVTEKLKNALNENGKQLQTSTSSSNKDQQQKEKAAKKDLKDEDGNSTFIEDSIDRKDPFEMPESSRSNAKKMEMDDLQIFGEKNDDRNEDDTRAIYNDILAENELFGDDKKDTDVSINSLNNPKFGSKTREVRLLSVPVSTTTTTTTSTTTATTSSSTKQPPIDLEDQTLASNNILEDDEEEGSSSTDTEVDVKDTTTEFMADEEKEPKTSFIDLDKEDNNSESVEENLTSAASNDEANEERVKRNVLNTNKLKRRRRRSTQRRRGASDGLVLTLTTSDGRQIELDEAYCDPGQDDERYAACVLEGSASSNVTYLVPVSKFFTDTHIKLTFRGRRPEATPCVGRMAAGRRRQLHPGVQGACSANNNRSSDSDLVLRLDENFSEDEVEQNGEEQHFWISIAEYKLTEVIFREAIEARPPSSRSNVDIQRSGRESFSSSNNIIVNGSDLCEKPVSSLGSEFREITLKFYRVCHQ